MARLLVWITVPLAALLLAGGGHAAKPGRGGSFVDLPKLASSNIGSAHVTIWLPPGYGRGKKRYGVVYMQDAENLFFLKKSNFNKVWAADKSVLRLVANKAIEPVIIVGIYSPGADRARTYLPQRLYESLTPGLKAEIDPLLKGRMQSDAYLRFLVSELKPIIDMRYRTLADRDHTAIMGSSMGALISLYAIAEYPGVFGLAACVSTHWPLVNPLLSDSRRGELRAAWDQYLTDHLGPPNGRRIWFDHGDQTLDGFYGPWQTAADVTLMRIGWQPQRDFETRSYPGAAHEENAWAARLDEIFGWLLGPHVND
ncbi:alpha/beta hydrolase [Sphingomonas sp. 28-63-12]|uniref:alpha/beta hydrolase n=1 Tax=Sphingomonas sp. 28-63-12 TaxID=1970434 RepID=UPI000BD178B6|nr:MAG: hypothetical protein B7Y47_14510 [Sphingomonas sp. 28-63-12]